MRQDALKTAILAIDMANKPYLDIIRSNIECHVFKTYQSFENSVHTFDAIIVFHSQQKPAPVLSLVSLFNPMRLIVLSDCSDENSIVNALHTGAHHFINLAEPKCVLVARLDAALRRHPRIEHRVLKIHPYTFFLANRTVLHGKCNIDLTPREFELAHYLFTNLNRIISDSELLTGVWTLPSSMDTRRIDTAVCRIRRKLDLKSESSNWSLIRLRGCGYRLMSVAHEQGKSVRLVESV